MSVPIRTFYNHKLINNKLKFPNFDQSYQYIFQDRRLLSKLIKNKPNIYDTLQNIIIPLTCLYILLNVRLPRLTWDGKI